MDKFWKDQIDLAIAMAKLGIVILVIVGMLAITYRACHALWNLIV